jgi:uncharacterized protein (DUF1800 family)
MASLDPVAGSLGTSRAAHLLRRALFGYSKSTLTQFSGLTAQAAVDLLFVPALPVTPPLDPESSPLQTWIGGTAVSEGFELEGVLLNWWIGTMKNSGTGIREKMVYYLHTHIPTIMDRTGTEAVYYQLALYRYYATGNFKNLMRAVCIDNAMLAHLDGRYNVAGAPQENFAREFFELFTVGKGEQVSADNYTTFTEQDVKAATEVFTGWEVDNTFQTIDPITLIPTGKLKGNGTNASQHKAGPKTFSAAFQNTVITTSANTVAGANQELTDFIEMVFAQDHTAEYIVRRLYRFFIYYYISDETETDIIQPLAQQLKASNYELGPTLKTLLMSKHFYDEDDNVLQNDIRGAIIKSPVELVLGALNLFGITLPSETTNNLVFHQCIGKIRSAFENQGLGLYYPYDVAGYEAYYQFPSYNRCWITANYLAERYKIFGDLISGNIPGITFDFVQWVKLNITNASDPDILVDELFALMFPVVPDTARRTFFRDDILLDGLSVLNWQTEWSAYLTLGDDAGVRLQLEKLFLALTQSPEFQIH